jgi:hypothetical protein
VIRLKEHDPDKLVQAWKEELSPPAWQNLKEAAEKEDYDGLKVAIRNVIPK